MEVRSHETKQSLLITKASNMSLLLEQGKLISFLILSANKLLLLIGKFQKFVKTVHTHTIIIKKFIRMCP
jgi:hypothetical protein